MKTQVLICHSYKASPAQNWYLWLADVLNEKGYDAKVLEMPSPSAPTEPEWVECIKTAHTSSPVILVGHSLGCRAILAYINQYNVETEAVILAACPMFWEGAIETRPLLKAYVDGMQPLDFEKIKKLVKRFELFHDTSDHLLPLKNVERLKELLGEKATVHVSDQYGHFDVKQIQEMATLF